MAHILISGLSAKNIQPITNGILKYKSATKHPTTGPRQLGIRRGPIYLKWEASFGATYVFEVRHLSLDYKFRAG